MKRRTRSTLKEFWYGSHVIVRAPRPGEAFEGEFPTGQKIARGVVNSSLLKGGLIEVYLSKSHTTVFAPPAAVKLAPITR